MLTLSGAASFEGGAVTGSGTITASGDTKSYSLALEGSTVFSNTGTLTDTSVLYAGYNSSDTAQLVNQSSGTVRLLGGTSLYGGGAGAFSNAGTVVKSGSGSVVISAAFTSTGAVSVAQGLLRLSGSANTLGGTISGAGTLELSSNATSLNLTTLSVGGMLLDGASVTLGAALAYGGPWTQTYGTLALDGNTLTLSGAASLDGGQTSGSGQLAVSGTTEIANYAIGGSTVLDNTGTLTVAAGGVLSVGASGSDTATLSNLAAGTITLLGSATIGGSGAASFSNAGSLLAEGGGAKYVYPATVNAGAIEVAQGSLTFLGAVSGNGGFTLDSGTTLSFSAAVTGNGGVTLGADSTLDISTSAGFSDHIAGFAAGDLIELAGFGFNTSAPPVLSFNTTTDKLSVTEGSTSFTLTFTGTHAAGDFLAIDNAGTVGIVHS
jgi:fibronectin-binding autotransporter adhesin